ncbi:baeyer-Villiger monooxygenase [Folsomia candida]|uniref:baeyer-Villiger monooxygenase n=1 Tax=Folsomia candida TaxID=158441 RepID=UPI001604DC20|nr:baeyer-Villiger monooxygenase [Folsomia candida]XP_035701471.1 baeyer-Villiger monooxygenase [Folsomia candida]
MGSSEDTYEILVIGAGFSGIYALHNLRKKGFAVKVYEAGTYMGGTWYWNRYPGARVDTDNPIYQFNEEGLWDFAWTERFPAHPELQEYFRYLDDKLQLSKDIQYNTSVSAAQFDTARNQWQVKTDDGRVTWANHLFLCTGSTTTRYTPPFKGLDRFKGICHHSYVWPKDGVNFDGKRVAVIGTGASAVQIIQEIGSRVGHLTVYQRTPNLCLPMQQAKAADPSKAAWFPPKSKFPEIFGTARKSFSGLNFDWERKNAADVSPKERRALYESLYAHGGFAFWLANFQDMLFDKESNAYAYTFWAEKARARIHDSVKRDILTPLVAPHAIGIKRPCLEQTYYEVFNQSNVDLVNVRESPILEITEHGVRTENEGLVEVDIIVLATGFDSLTGSIKSMDIRNGKGESLRDMWKRNGTSTYLGLTTAGFPNLWYMYGPQAPTPLGNGPTIIEIQGEWLVELMVRMKDEKRRFVDAKKESEQGWTKEVWDAWEASLFPEADSWYQGANIPGKTREPLCYAGGYSKYEDLLKKIAAEGYKTFNLA